MDNCEFSFKQIFFAGVGAVAMTAEKTNELIRELVKKGEMTIEQGAIINEELKHNVGAKMRSAADAIDPRETPSLIDMMDNMSKEELASIKAKLMELEKDE